MAVQPPPPGGSYPPPQGAFPQGPGGYPPQPYMDGPAPGVRFAGHPARFIAYLIDGFILGVIIGALWLLFAVVFAAGAATESGALVGGSLILFSVLAGVVGIAYLPWFWSRGGQTPGMKLMHLRVVRDADGGPIGGGTAIVRLIGFYISGAIFYLGFIWILIDKRRRGWADLIAGTCVVEA